MSQVKKAGEEDKDPQDNQVKALNDLQETRPFTAEEVSDQRDGGGPQHRAGKVEKQEAGPGQLKHPGKGAGDDTKPGNKPCKENRPGSVALKNRLGLFDVMLPDKKTPGVPIQKATATPASDPVAEVVAQRGATYGNDDNPLDLQFHGIAVGGKEGGHQQDSFARHGDSHILEHDPEKDRPVSIEDEEVDHLLEKFLHGNGGFNIGLEGPLSGACCSAQIVPICREKTMTHSTL
jgi:hypothetical protein